MTATAANHQMFRFSALLRSVFPKNTAKLTARAAGATIRSAENWLADRCSPSAETLFRMARENNELRAALMQTLAQGSNYEEPTVDGRVVARGAARAPLGQLGTQEG